MGSAGRATRRLFPGCSGLQRPCAVARSMAGPGRLCSAGAEAPQEGEPFPGRWPEPDLGSLPGASGQPCLPWCTRVALRGLGGGRLRAVPSVPNGSLCLQKGIKFAARRGSEGHESPNICLPGPRISLHCSEARRSFMAVSQSSDIQSTAWLIFPVHLRQDPTSVLSSPLHFPGPHSDPSS